MSPQLITSNEVITVMDYTAFWNIVPDVAIFLFILGMTGVLVIDFGRARTSAAQPAAVRTTTPAQDESLAA
jgi:hypothetical protein